MLKDDIVKIEKALKNNEMFFNFEMAAFNRIKNALEAGEQTGNKASLKFLRDIKDDFIKHIQLKFNCSSVSREMDIASEGFNFIVKKLQAGG